MAAVIGWGSARAVDGAFILRIEDIDQARCSPEFETSCIQDMRWLGLDWDEGPVRQSDRFAHYDACLEALAAAGLVYACTCSRSEVRAAQRAPHLSRFFADLGRPRPYPGTCRTAGHATLDPDKGGWRLDVDRLGDDAIVTVDDYWLGPHQEDVRATCGDFMLGRSGVPTYQLAAVYDDRAMGITDVVRGHDLQGSSARQVLLHRQLDRLEARAPGDRGTSIPRFAHHPLIITPAGDKLSKRDRSLTIAGLRDDGMTAQQLIAMVCASIGLVPPQTRSMRPADVAEALTEASEPGGLSRPSWRDGTLIRFAEDA